MAAVTDAGLTAPWHDAGNVGMIDGSDAGPAACCLHITDNSME